MQINLLYYYIGGLKRMQEQNEINLNRAPVWRAFRAAAPQTLPVFAGYLVLGLGYGIYVQMVF